MSEDEQQSVLSIVEKVSGTKDPVDFIPYKRIAKVAGKIAPGLIHDWSGIIRTPGTYKIWDDGSKFQVICPKDPLLTELLVFDNLSGIRYREMKGARDFYDEVMVSPTQNRGRFEITPFPFTQLITTHIGGVKELQEVIESKDITFNRHTTFQPIVDEAKFVNPQNVFSTGFGPGELIQKIEKVWRFTEAFKGNTHNVQDSFWYEPIVVRGNIDQYSIIESRHRFLALKALGVPLVPVYFTK